MMSAADAHAPLRDHLLRCCPKAAGRGRQLSTATIRTVDMAAGSFAVFLELPIRQLP
jgi:hypothetical protein